jgi:hypothetical protein
MSRTHRRHYKTGIRIRDGKGHRYNWSTPGWWNRLFHNRPRRRAEKVLLQRIKHNPSLSDLAIWPVGRKPHWYFW